MGTERTGPRRSCGDTLGESCGRILRAEHATRDQRRSAGYQRNSQPLHSHDLFIKVVTLGLFGLGACLEGARRPGGRARQSEGHRGARLLIRNSPPGLLRVWVPIDLSRGSWLFVVGLYFLSVCGVLRAVHRSYGRGAACAPAVRPSMGACHAAGIRIWHASTLPRALRQCNIACDTVRTVPRSVLCAIHQVALRPSWLGDAVWPGWPDCLAYSVQYMEWDGQSFTYPSLCSLRARTESRVCSGVLRTDRGRCVCLRPAVRHGTLRATPPGFVVLYRPGPLGPARQARPLTWGGARGASSATSIHCH